MEHLTERQISELFDGKTRGAALGEALVHFENCAVCRLKRPNFSKSDLRKMILREANFDVEDGSEIMLLNLSERRRPWMKVWQFGLVGVALLMLLAGLWWFINRQEKPQIVKSNTSPPVNENINPGSPTASPNGNASDVKNTAKNVEKTPESSASPEKTPDQNLQNERELALNLEKFPEALVGLESPNIQLRSNSGGQNSFFVKYPIGEVIRETRPVLQWNAVSDAVGYQVSVFDENYNEIFSTQVNGTSWQIETPLRRGAKYQWQVKTLPRSSDIPVVISKPALFKVANEATLVQIDTGGEIRKAESLYKAGLLDEAEKTLRQILKEKPQDKRARQILQKIEVLRKKLQKPPTDIKPAQ